MENSRLNHINYLLSAISLNRLDNNNCDCIIKTDDYNIGAHQFMLELASPVLERIIYTIKKSKDTNSIIIELNKMTEISIFFPKILDFIYTGKIIIEERDVFEILDLAGFLEIPFIINICCKIISDLLTLDNIILIYKKALSMKQNALIRICQSFFCFNFFDSNLLKEIPSLEFFKIISDSRLILRNPTTKEFFVGQRYLCELLRIIMYFNLVYSDMNVYDLNLHELKTQIMMNFRSNQIENDNEIISFDDFINEKCYAGPCNFTCPAGLHLPFGMHPFQGQNLPHRTSLCSQTVLNTIGECTPDKWKIKKIKFYIVKKWNNQCKVVAGMDFMYQQIWNDNELKVIKCHIENLKKYRVKELLLGPKENIVKVQITHSWIVNSFSFESDQGRKFGPFGDPNPTDCQVQLTEIDIRQHGPGLLYLHGFHYIDIISCGWRICNQLSLECAFIDTQRVQHDYKAISHYMIKEIGTRHQTYDVDRGERDSNIAIINVRPLAFWSNEVQ